MTRMYRCLTGAALAALAALGPVAAVAEPLTAERAAQIALQNNGQIVNAEAAVLDARGGLYRAYAGVLPNVGASLTRSGQRIDDATAFTFTQAGLGRFTYDEESYGTTPQISGSWSVLNLSALYGLGSGWSTVRSARHARTAARHDVRLAVKRQFYEVVRAIQLSQVATDALKLARDDGRRVQALFEVGSVSKSDVLKALVRTAQGELDSLRARQNVINQRIALASLIGIRETEMGAVDTVLTASVRTWDEAAVLAEAEGSRPDLKAAQAEVHAARANRWSARLSRLPYVTVSGQAQFNTSSSSLLRGKSETDRAYSGQIALNMDLFDLTNDAGSASAKARELRARESLDALRRNLASEVRQALLSYQEVVEARRVAESAVESATENLKLTQEKYNVGSATILELIDAQVQLQRTRSDLVSALAAIRVAEAAIDRVRGAGE